MSEEEIIYILKQRIERKTVSSDPYYITQKAIEGLLDLYNKEKEKNKEAIEYINKNCSTYNCDFMDDGVGNLFKDILELLEERN